jgi:hypothetical protein
MPYLFHFTSSAQLPRIIRNGELRPATYIGGPRDFVHAAENKNGDRTAAGWGSWEPTYRAGGIRRVRVTVDAADFEPWLAVYARYPEWTPDLIARLVMGATLTELDHQHRRVRILREGGRPPYSGAHCGNRSLGTREAPLLMRPLDEIGVARKGGSP